MNLTDAQKIDFMKKAAFIADNASCLYKIGCVGVVADVGQTLSAEVKNDPQFRRKDGYIYLKTWNETIHGEIYCQECDSGGKKICIRQVEHLKGRDFQKVCSIHAEALLIAKCARYGISTSDMHLFVTNSPCYTCAKVIISAGVSYVYYLSEHTDTTGIDMLKENAVRIEKLSDTDF